MTLAPFDVVVVPFPYSDTLAEKRRPALIVSAAEVLGDNRQVWVAMVTTSRRAMFGDLPITDLEHAGLSVACKLRAAKITTLDVQRIVRRTGALSPEDRERARAALSSCAAF